MKLTSQQITKYIFWPAQIAVLILILVNAYLIFEVSLNGTNIAITFASMYSFGMILGLISFGFFVLALLPGILGRFGIKGEVVKQLIIYRRETGKLMFLFALAHYLTVKVFPMIALDLELDFPLYQTIGFVALQLTLLLFITSTNWAQKKMGIWWKRLHQLVYLIVWLIFLHVALAQGISIVSVIIAFVAIAEMMSLANFYIFKINLE
jgi:DMSO/TMAO reductase YedYZ heme-binding membrane subunit